MKSKTRYVYYDKIGHITHILAKKRRGRASYVECSVDDVIGLLDGSESINGYVVAYNTLMDEYQLLKKDNVIRLRKTSDKLYKIPCKKNVEADLRLTYFPDNVLEATLDMSRISPLYQTNFKEEVRFERGTELRFILKEADSGNLVKEIVIDAQDLLESGQLFFELYDHIRPDNLDIFTYGLLSSYCWHEGKAKLMSPLKDKIKFEVHKADLKRRSTDFEYHLVVKPGTNGLNITNNIESIKLIRFNKAIEFFIVDKHDPNILYDKFFLEMEDIKSDMIFVKTDVNLSGKALLYNHKYISVLIDT